MNGRVLVVDDEKNITLVVEAMLDRAGFEVLSFNESSLALAAIDEEEFDLVITDLYMPGKNGLELLEHCKQNHPQLPVVMITAFGTVESAVRALKKGAFDFITKPFDQTELLNVVQKAVRTRHRRDREPASLLPIEDVQGSEAKGDPSTSADLPISSIIGASAQMQEVFRVIGKVANSTTTVLILGESGTGKELVAYELHRRSSRSKMPFIKINCAAIPSTLIESELFGYEKGAFTGASTSKPGRFELAHEGTLFLDEIGEMPLEMQVKLLRVLQEQEFERVGGVQSLKVDVRIITATNRDLEAEVKAGRFREDLFYRLNVVPLLLPPLRERKEDIDLLVSFFLKQFGEKMNRENLTLSESCRRALHDYAWPGNIRQLENVLERMVLMSDGDELKPSDLPDEVSNALHLRTSGERGIAEPLNFKEIVRRKTQNVERELIEKALEECGGNVTRTAEHLGLSRKGLQLKMKELGLKRIPD